MDHEYFVSTSETAIEMNMLKKFDCELLLGQISYNQKAEVCNCNNGYPVHPKKCSTLKQHEMPEPRLVQKINNAYHKSATHYRVSAHAGQYYDYV